MKNPSIRVFLLAAILSLLSVLWLAITVVSYRNAHQMIDSLLDTSLARTARVLLSQAQHEIRETNAYEEEKHPEHLQSPDLYALETLTHLFEKYEKQILFQVYRRAGELLTRSSEGLPNLALSPESGFQNVHGGDGTFWRVYSLWDPERRIQVQVFLSHDLGQRVARKIAQRLTLPFILALPLAALAVLFVTHLAFRRLRQDARRVREMSPLHLDQLPVNGVPQEAVPLIESINALTSRIQSTLDKERRFTADAAHELRTPLSGLRAQAEVALGSSSEQEKNHALRQIIAATERTTHVVQQLLILARVDSEASSLRLLGEVDLKQLASTVLAEQAPQALVKNMEIELSGEARLYSGNAELLRILLRNLVDNSIKYGCEGSRIQVRLEQSEKGALLRVADSGPGVPGPEQERIFDRFFRGKSAKAGGSGLGLSIVRRIAELHGARIELGPGLSAKGLSVTLHFTS